MPSSTTSTTFDSGAMAGYLQVVLVGMGQAGHIHAKTYKTLPDCRLIALVDTSLHRRTLAEKGFAGIKIFESLEHALGETGGDVVVDLCVPAPQNIALCQTAIRHGVQRLMLEKPIGWQLSEAVELGEILYGRSALYLDTYRFSNGIEMLQQEVKREGSPVKHIHIRFLKDRKKDSAIARGFHDQTHPDAWHIEGPHMITIAEQIAGDIVAIEDAHLYDMHADGKTLPHHGGGDSIIRHRGGALTMMVVDLGSKSNERVVEVFLENGVLFQLLLPCSKSSEHVSRLEKRTDGRVEASFAIEDRPMEQCVSACIEHFRSRNGEIPTIARGIAINDILQKICAMARRQAHTSGDSATEAT